jgi:formylglycine-generating enzyme required for sulfatase activity
VRLDGAAAAYVLVLQPTQVAYRAARGEPLVFPGRSHRRAVDWSRLPVAGVSFDDARAYAAWLAASGRVPGARLCDEREWERAARGADGRSYPQGERLEPDDADIDVTYGRAPLGYGPDEVGSHPRSRSPFGVDDLTGNVWEWVRGPGDAAMLRGGGWYHGAISALTMNRDFDEPGLRAAWAGVRICADAPF